MKFEIVEFYPMQMKKFKNIIGTVHIYAIDCGLDIRGIRVSMNGKSNSMYFHLPHYSAIDAETGKIVRYPHIRWTKQETHEEMMNFLHREVKAYVSRSLTSQSENLNNKKV